MRSGMRSNRAAGAAARRRLNRPQSCRKKSPSAARRQRLKAIAVTMGVPLNLGPATMQPRVRRHAAAALVILLAACGRGSPVARIHAKSGEVEVALEVAVTPEAQQRGLMYRTSLADDHGMLFVFPVDADHAFWMKNTLIPLDMLFIAADGQVVGIHANATPLSMAPIQVGQPSRYVLEVPGGYTQRRGITTGDRVELSGLPPG